MAEQRAAEIREEPEPIRNTLDMTKSEEDQKLLEAIERGEDPLELLGSSTPDPTPAGEPAPAPEVKEQTTEPAVVPDVPEPDPAAISDPEESARRQAELENLEDLAPELREAMERLPDEERKLFEVQLATDRHRLLRAEAAIGKRRAELDRVNADRAAQLQAVMAREQAMLTTPQVGEPAAVPETGIPLEVGEDGTVSLKPSDIEALVDQRVEAAIEPRAQALQADQQRRLMVGQELQNAQLDQTAQKALGASYDIFRKGMQDTLTNFLNRAPTRDDLRQMNMPQLVDLMKQFGVEDQIKAEYPDLEIEDLADLELGLARPEMRRLASSVLTKFRSIYNGPPERPEPVSHTDVDTSAADPPPAAPRPQVRRGSATTVDGNATEQFLALSSRELAALPKDEYAEWKRRLAAEGYQLS